MSGPYRQFLTTFWFGSEIRETLEIHRKHYYQEQSELVKNVIDLPGDLDYFNKESNLKLHDGSQDHHYITITYIICTFVKIKLE